MLKKNILILFGFIFLTFGIIGIITPILPTTPFILLSAYLFSKSSQKWHYFILNNKLFGKYIKDYQERRGITLKNKINAFIFLTVSLSISALKTENLYLRIFFVVIFISVSFHIMKLRTLK